MTVIYVDTLFLLNALVDYLLLLAAARLAGEPLRRVRFALGGGGTAPEDKLEELIRQGSRFDSFIVKP